MKSPLWAAIMIVLASLVLENSTVALTPKKSNPLGNLTSGEIIKAKVNFELSRKVEFSDFLLGAIKGIHTLFLLPKAIIALKAVTLITTVLCPVMKLLQVAGSKLEALSVFVLPSVKETLKEEFDEVNLKLDALTLQLQNVAEELESNIEFQSWFPLYTDYKFKIMNGEKKLVQTMSQMEAATDRRQKLRSAKEYTDYYKSQDIEGAMRNIFRLTAKDSTTTQPNLFQLYSKKHNCDVGGLVKFMFVILSLTFSGSIQMYAFAMLTNKSQADESLKYIFDEFEKAKHQYEKQVWSCFESAIERAKKKTNDIMVSNPEMTGSKLSSKIHSELSELVPWYKWSVVQYKHLLDFRQIGLPLGSAESYCMGRPDVLRGHQLFIAKHNDRNILVMWEDENTKSHGCHEITDASTFVSFQLCEKCNAGALQTSKDTLNRERCPNYIQSTFLPFCKDPLKLISQELNKYTFLAVGFQRGYHACQESTCGGHGSCRTIPYTNQHMCLCHQYFFGHNCETRYNLTDTLLARDVIASVRNSFSNFTGVPDVIDVYFQMQKFSTQLQEMQRNIEGLHKYNSKLILYGDAFTKAELVAEKYSHLLSGSISENKFGKDLEKLDLNFENIFWNLNKMILGEGILVSEGVLTSLKKSQKADFACTADYQERIMTFIKDLLFLDEEVTEAQLRFLCWKLNNKGFSEGQYPVLQKRHIIDTVVARQRNYLQHWEKNSCPELSAENLIENGCIKRLSYEGLNVVLHCSNGMTPSVPSVTCQKVNGTLEWSAKPICQYLWSAWSSWSICSKTCGGGQRSRSRQKLNGETDTETQSCETQDCCQQKYEKFKCNDGQCVSSSSVCDGNLDCADGSDESDDRQCNYLRDGDTVALKTGCGGFMSCCEGVWFRNDMLTLSNCPLTTVEKHDWARCPNIHFRMDLIKKERKRGPIRFGDEITITSKRSGICMNCQKHDYHWMIFRTGIGNVCRTAKDHKLTWMCKIKIFARNRLGKCNGSIHSSCKGDPIRQRDVLYLRQGGKWISGSDPKKWVCRTDCPGQSITQRTGCKCEQWTVFRR